MKLYSKEYSNQLKQLHKEKKAFGSKAVEFKKINKIINDYSITSILDYGCGKGALIEQLKKQYPDMNISGYDPGNDLYSNVSGSYQLVTSTDVLEHIEPELLDNVLQHIKSLSEKLIYLEISCYPSKKKLPDGRNAHLIIEKPEWWKNKLLKFFSEENFIEQVVVDKGIKETKNQKINLIYFKLLIKL